MSLEGELNVRIDWDGRRVQRVAVRSTRRFLVQRLVAGKPAAEAHAIVPRLFGICRRAQDAAASCAIAACAPADGTPSRDHRIPVLLETVQEYVQRILIDWPRAMGRTPVIGPVAVVRQRVEAFLAEHERGDRSADEGEPDALFAVLAATVAESVFGMPVGAWRQCAGYDDVWNWAAEGATVPAAMFHELLRDAPTLGASDVAPMPAASGAALAAVVAPALRRDPQFARAPTWGGAPVETGAWPRVRTQPLVAAVAAKCGNSVATRMLARMVELAALVDGGIAGDGSTEMPAPVDAWSLAPDEGMAAVQTARGLLVHRARLAGGRVAEYQIVAPTEWNFHPDGAFPRGIVGLAAPDEPTLVRHAHLAAQALDPCIACRIDIGHA